MDSEKDVNVMTVLWWVSM